MTAIPPTAAGEHLGGSTRRGSLVVAGSALGGLASVVLWQVWSYSFALGHRADGDGRHLAPLPYWSPFLLIPLVALVGARLAPDRTRAVVLAACAPQVLLVLVSKGALLVDPTRLGAALWLELWAREIILVLLTWLAARWGRRLALR